MTQVAILSGNWSTAASWGTITNESTFATSTTTQTITTTTQYSTAFTAPNTTNAVTAIMTSITGSVTSSPTNSADIVCVLEEYNGAAWVEKARGSFNTVDYPYKTDFSGTGWMLFDMTTPYTFTTTTASYYRVGIKLENVTGTVGGLTVRAQAGMRQIFAIDDRNAVPAINEDVIICGTLTRQVSIKLDGNQECGADAVATTAITDGGVHSGVLIGYNGKLYADTAADCSLIINGNLVFGNNSAISFGTIASPHPAAYKATILLNCGTRAYYMTNRVSASVHTAVDMSFVGAPKSSTTLYKSLITSGVGTAASPLVTTTAVDWSVNDLIALLPGTNSATNYNETEYKYIKTKNSSTSYVLSATVGGAESATTYAHTGSYAVNIERNVVIGHETGLSFYLIGQLTWTGSGFQGTFTSQMNFKWMKFLERVQTVIPTTTQAESSWAGKFSYDYNVIEGRIIQGSGPLSTVPATYTGLIYCRSVSPSTGTFTMSNCAQQTFRDLMWFDQYEGGVSLGGISNVFYDTIIAACPKSGAATVAGIHIISGDNSKMIRPISFACRRSFYFTALSSGPATLIDGSFGVLFYNQTVHASFTSSTYLGVFPYFQNCTFGSNLSDIKTYSADSTTFGWKISWQKHAGVEYDNGYHAYYGDVICTGASLSDTTVRTASSYGMRCEAYSGRSFIHRFLIVSRPGQATSILGYAKRNAAMDNGTTITIGLRLPGSTSYDATTTLSSGTSWQLWSLAADYTGTVPAYAEVEISFDYPGVSAAYVYFDDIMNGNNDLTAIDLWHQGSPSPVMYNELGNPYEVWDVANSGFATGTMGDVAGKTYIAADDAATLSLIK